jgi:hypothetical protein
MDPIGAGGVPAWDLLGRWAAEQAAALPVPVAAGPGVCRTCFGPARPGSSRCFQCGLHAECAPGSLASVVLPMAYAVKGGPLARSLWLYKSQRPGAAAARRALTVLLLVFLREHGRCAWRAAGLTGPTHLAVVPSSRGRAGPHPLRSMTEPYLRLPWADLSVRPGGQDGERDLDPGRFRAAPLDGSRVLLLDDTWTTGASAQSATMALRRAGASAVAVIVLGRHVAPPWPRPAGPGPAGAFSLRACAVHTAASGTAHGRTRRGART